MVVKHVPDTFYLPEKDLGLCDSSDSILSYYHVPHVMIMAS